MRLLFLIVPAFAVLVLQLGCKKPRSHEPTDSVKVELTTFQTFTNEAVAYPSALWELAAARFEADREKGQRVILTLHDSSGVQKYSDGRVTVVSLPAPNAEYRLALGLYAQQYNVFNLQAADEMALNGRVSEARELYRLLQHFDSRGGLKTEIGQKLRLLEEMERAGGHEDAVAKLKEVYSQHFSRLGLSEIDSVKTTMVTNLLELKLP